MDLTMIWCGRDRWCTLAVCHTGGNWGAIGQAGKRGYGRGGLGGGLDFSIWQLGSGAGEISA